MRGIFMKKSIFILLFILIFLIPIYADENIYDVKGDFKNLCLGDSEDTTYDKINYLNNKGDISGNYFKLNNYFYVNILDEGTTCYFDFYKEKLYYIDILFNKYSANELEGTLKPFIMNQLKPMLIKSYGNPSSSGVFPNILSMKDGFLNIIMKWIFKKKTIVMGIYESEFQYQARIIITDNVLKSAKEQEDKLEQKNSQEKSSKDF
jgi:hypothetical protein